MAYPISDVTRRVVYTGSAGTGPYSFTFEILANTDILVYKNTTLLTLTTNYTVTINSNGTGYVTLTSAATSSDNITIVGDRAIQRATDFVTGGDLFANTLNDEFDSLVIFAQQVDEKADRSLKAPVTDPTDVNMVLPLKANRSNKYLGFDSDGNPVAVAGTSSTPGTMGSQNSNNVSITGGSITGITDLAVADGGTGASTASGARTNLSAAQSGANSDITSITGLTTALSASQGGTGITSVGTSGNVLISNGTAWTSSALPAALTGMYGQVFTSSGTFTIPSGVTAVKVTVVGGGGNGGNAGAYSGAGGGGGGGVAIKYVTGLTAGGTVTVTVGGIAGTSSFGAHCSATGGSTASNVGTNTSSSGGSGGSGSSGDLNLSGTSGSNGIYYSACCVGTFWGGGTGGAASGSPNSSGQYASAIGSNPFGSYPSAGMFGGGGQAGSGAATGYGNGGGGARGGTSGTVTGGAGKAGIVIVEW